MIISGYFSCRSTRTTLQKPVKLLVQVMSFSLVWNLLANGIKGTWTIKGVIGSLIPANYFVILYIATYLLSPYLNLLYERMNKNFLILLLLLFSFWPTLVEVFAQLTGREWNGLSTIGMYGSQWGYQIVNFIMMYFIGMFIRKYSEKLRGVKTYYLVLLFVCVTAAITIWASISEYCGYSRNMAWIYCNSLVIVEAVLVFLLFSRLSIGSIKQINKLASACFTVFLAHGYFITHIKIEWAVRQNSLIMLGHIVACIILIYLICFIVDVAYRFIYKAFFKRLEQKEIVITQL